MSFFTFNFSLRTSIGGMKILIGEISKIPVWEIENSAATVNPGRNSTDKIELVCGYKFVSKVRFCIDCICKNGNENACCA